MPHHPSRLTAPTAVVPLRARSRARIAARIAAPVVALIVALGSATHTVAAQHKLVALSLDDPAYDMFDAMNAAGCAPARMSAYRPWLVRDVRDAIRRAGVDSSCSRAILDVLRSRFASDTFDIFSDNEGSLSAGGQLTVRATQLSGGEFRPLWRGVRDKAEGDPPLTAVARARLTWGSNNMVAVGEIVGFTSRQNDPLVRQRALRNTSGALDFGESYVTGQLGNHVTMSFGRMSEAWLGHGRESLLLSAHAPPLDRLMISGRWRRVEGRALYASISDVQLSPALDSISVPAGTSAHFYRYLVAHALTIRPGRGMEITLGETALLARGGRTVDLAYANPFMFYTVSQNDTSRAGADQNDNLQIFGALRLRSGGSQLFAELLIDDIQIDPQDRKTIQDQLGWSLRGVQTVPLGVSSNASAEYRHVNSFTYQRASYATVYQSYGSALGSELGSDADMVRGAVESWITSVVRVAAGAGLWRQGAQRLDQRPGRSVNGSGEQPYPSVTAARPLVQRALLGDASVRYLRYPLVLGASVELASVKNPRNQPAPTMSLARIQVTGSYAYRIP